MVGFALLAVGTSLGMTAATLLARTGLGFPLPLLGSCLGIVALSTAGPAMWAMRVPERQAWVGPATAVLLVLSCGIVGALGVAGAVLICVAALACVTFGGWRFIGRDRRPALTGVLLGSAMAVAAALLLSMELGGTKYVNFLMDQLILHGRADGDDYLNAALTKSLSSFLVPATGTDGIAPVRYHFGFYALAATLTDLAGGDAALALIGLQMIVLAPMLGFALAQGAALLGARLFPGLQMHPLPIAALAFVAVPLAQLGGIANLVAYSTSMLLGGILLTLLSPSLLVQVSADHARAGETTDRPWWLAVLAIPFLALAKISAGYVWTAVGGYLALRKIGLRHLNLWLLGLAMAILFFGSLYLLAPAGGGGGQLLGTPYYVERGFAEGNYLLPLQTQWQSLAALAALFLLRRVAVGGARSLLIEALIIAIVAANLPGLLMEIGGGDAVYFLVAGEWFALPILLAALAAAPGALAAASRARRITARAVTVAAAAGLLVGLVETVPVRVHIFISAQALVHTGDRGYFSDHRKRALKADAERALRDRSLLGLMRQPAAPPLGLNLADRLRAISGAPGTGAIAFAAPESEYWILVAECDGSSLWPMAVAGVSMLAGQTTSKASCSEHQILGDGLPDVALSPAASQNELCALARQRGFASILTIDGLDRSPTRTACGITVSGLDGPS